MVPSHLLGTKSRRCSRDSCPHAYSFLYLEGSCKTTSFRQRAVPLTADVANMYRQIKARGKDTDFERIVWRQDPRQPNQYYM
jgi:hypothetical protein